jgi:hypothetical protein
MAARIIPGLTIAVENPVHWLEEVSDHEDHQ